MFWMFFRSQTVSWAYILHHLGPTIITCPIKSLSAQAASNGQHMPRTRQRKRLAAICTDSACPLTTQACQTFSSQPTSEDDLKAKFISMKLPKHRAAPHVKRMRARDNPHSKRSVEKACQALRCPLFKLLRFSEGLLLSRGSMMNQPHCLCKPRPIYSLSGQSKTLAFQYET